jgi:hypothetical protein
MELMIFDRYRVLHEQLDDGEGNEVSLEDHVEYVLNYSGTPDGDCADLEDFEDAEHFFNVFSETDSVFVDYINGNELTKDDIYDFYEGRE